MFSAKAADEAEAANAGWQDAVKDAEKAKKWAKDHPQDKGAQDAASQANNTAIGYGVGAAIADDMATEAGQIADDDAKKGSDADKKAHEKYKKKRKAKRDAAKALHEFERAVKEMDESSKKQKFIETLNAMKEEFKELAFLPPAPGATELATLVAEGKLAVTLTGTGETIGHIADLTLRNISGQPLQTIAMMSRVLDSVSGQAQPYCIAGGLPGGAGDAPGYIAPMFSTLQPGAIQPLDTKVPVLDPIFKNLFKDRNKTEPLMIIITPKILTTAAMKINLGPGAEAVASVNGVCLDGHKPPVAKGNTTDMAFAKPADADALASLAGTVQGVDNIIATTRQLQALKKFTTPFSGQPDKERCTVVQWTTWAFTSATTSKPITQNDLAAKVHEQTGAKTDEQKAQLQPGVNQIWNAVQLTGAGAKVL